MAIEFDKGSVGAKQLKPDHYRRKAIVEFKSVMKYSVLSNTEQMPNNSGKTIRGYRYYPVLDDRNINDQGIDANGAVMTKSGNFYGSSRDFSRITEMLPLNREMGGRINRFGFTRVDFETSLTEYGMFFEYTEDLLQFDSEPNLVALFEEQAMKGAIQIYEDILLLDLLSRAGSVQYCGKNTVSHATMDTGDTTTADTDSVLKYKDLVTAAATLKLNDVPQQTKMITGSTKVDTRVISSSYIAYTTSEVIELMKSLGKERNKDAWIDVEQYVNSETDKVNPDEKGKIGAFRVVEDVRMIRWKGEGASVGSTTAPLTNTAGKWDIHPILVIGSDAFVTMSLFSKGSKNDKIIIKHVSPQENVHSDEPYGKKGFTSYRFWYGTLILRPERIHLIKTLA